MKRLLLICFTLITPLLNFAQSTAPVQNDDFGIYSVLMVALLAIFLSLLALSKAIGALSSQLQNKLRA